MNWKIISEDFLIYRSKSPVDPHMQMSTQSHFLSKYRSAENQQRKRLTKVCSYVSFRAHFKNLSQKYFEHGCLKDLTR